MLINHGYNSIFILLRFTQDMIWIELSFMHICIQIKHLQITTVLRNMAFILQVTEMQWQKYRIKCINNKSLLQLAF